MRTIDGFDALTHSSCYLVVGLIQLLQRFQQVSAGDRLDRLIKQRAEMIQRRQPLRRVLVVFPGGLLQLMEFADVLAWPSAPRPYWRPFEPRSDRGLLGAFAASE